MANYGISIRADPHTVFSVVAFNVWLKTGETYELLGRATTTTPVIIWGSTSGGIIEVQLRETGCSSLSLSLDASTIADQVESYPTDYQINGCQVVFHLQSPPPPVMSQIVTYMSAYEKQNVSDLSNPVQMSVGTDALSLIIRGSVTDTTKYFHFTCPYRDPILNVSVALVNQVSLHVDLTIPAKYGDIEIGSTPVGSSVTLTSVSGATTHQTPCSFSNMECMEYTITVTKFGYYPQQESYTLVEGTNPRKDYYLQPNPMYYGVVAANILPALSPGESFDVRDETGGLIAQNVTSFSQSGLGVIGAFSFFRKGYAPVLNAILQVMDPIQMESIDISFIRVTGTVHLTSNIPAMVIVDGVDTGKATPVDLTVAGGTHTLTLQCPNYTILNTPIYIGYTNEMGDTNPVIDIPLDLTLTAIPMLRVFKIRLDNLMSPHPQNINLCPLYGSEGVTDGINLIDSGCIGIPIGSGYLPIYRKLSLGRNDIRDIIIPLPDGVNPQQVSFYCESWGSEYGSFPLRSNITQMSAVDQDNISHAAFTCSTERVTCDVLIESNPPHSSVYATYLPPNDHQYVTELHQTPFTLIGVDKYLSESENRHLDHRPSYDFRFISNGFSPLIKTLTPDQDHNRVMGDYTAVAGYIAISISPSNAAIFDESGNQINDPATQVNPYRILSGVNVKRRFVLKHPLRYDTVIFCNYNGSPGGTRYYSVTMGTTASNLTIQTDPPGAKIYLDEWDTGEVTPHTFSLIPTGTHRYTLDRRDYNRITGEAILPLNQDLTVNVQLTKTIKHQPTINGSTAFY